MKWLLRGSWSLLALAVLAIAALYAGSGMIIGREYGLMARILTVTGVGLGDRDLGLMSKVAQNRFSHLTDAEVRALHAYLQTL